MEQSIAGFAAKAKANTLAMEDMAGGTFTISNGGVFGSLYGTPIINMPQSAILGMHATKMRPMVRPPPFPERQARARSRNNAKSRTISPHPPPPPP